MKIPGIVKVVVIGYVSYKLLTIKPIKKVIVGIAVAKGTQILEKQLLKD